jgi:hypothetical protein
MQEVELGMENTTYTWDVYLFLIPLFSYLDFTTSPPEFMSLMTINMVKHSAETRGLFEELSNFSITVQ